MVEVIINGTSIDLISKGVKYTKQVNDLADLSTVNTSFTYSIRADKTPKNTQLFQQLGMVGDTSKFPYQKNTTQLIDNGAVLISKGITTVKETNEEYKLFIQDGIIEVFKLIENKTLGKDLDLSELRHTKSEAEIIQSWNPGSPFRYLIADYNGRVNLGQGVLDGNYLIPSANVKYLLDKVFGSIGYTYSGFPNEIENHWVTYPKSVTTVPDDTVRFNAESKRYFVNQNGDWVHGIYSSAATIPVTGRKWGTIGLENGVTAGPPPNWNVESEWYATIQQPGRYVMDMDVGGSMLWWSSFVGAGIETDFKIGVLIVGEGEKGTFLVGSQNPEIDLGFLNAGSVIRFFVRELTAEEVADGDSSIEDLINSGLLVPISIKCIFNVTMRTTEINIYDFEEAFNDFTIKDFFKETMFRNSLTPFVDNHSKHIDFVMLDDRLDAEAVDWSDKYIRRVNERYVYQTYARENILRMKYNNPDERYNDGSIFVENEHLEDEKILLESKFYSPDRIPERIEYNTSGGNGFFTKARVWDKEIKEEQNAQGDTVQVIEYKTMTGRFYYLAQKQNPNTIEIYVDGGSTNSGFYEASLDGVLWPQILSDKYRGTDKIFTDTRIHEIELALSEVDFANIDMRKLYYFEQEMQYYILNKITWETGQPAKGEFIRVKRNG